MKIVRVLQTKIKKIKKNTCPQFNLQQEMVRILYTVLRQDSPSKKQKQSLIV